MTTEATLFPVGTNSSSHGIAGLRPDSYTAHKLKHAVPEHLHLTTRRFFIGPIPEGWLSSNRKSWYKRRLELSSYSSRQASFHAAQGQDYHRRSSSSLPAVSTATLGLSFPQPEDVDDEPSEDGEGEGEDTEEDEEDYDDADVMSRTLEPVSTDVQQGELESAEPVKIPPSKVSTERVASPTDTFHTANEGTPRQSTSLQPTASRDQLKSPNLVADTYRLSATSSMQAHGLDLPQDSTDAHSNTGLLPDSPDIKPNSSGEVVKTLSKYEPAPIDGDTASPQLKRRGTERVRFRVSEAVADRQERVGGKVDRARDRVGKKISRRQTLREGTIVKMEKMLVRLDLTTQNVPDEFDENGSLKVQTRTTKKWREFMVVARKSKKQDEDDFRLQFWKTRVIPEVDDENSSKKPAHEIKLISKNTHVNLFSSLDKSVVVWHPYKKGTRIVIMKAGSAAHSTEWYTFLKDILGWRRPSTLQVYVPDLDVYLSIDKPFKELEIAVETDDEATVAAKAAEAEQAVAGKIITECIKMLEGNDEWTDVTHRWHQTAKPGLAWKRYDRLEWVHGVNEQKMYGSMAMQHSYDLELRPKVHYPTHVFGKKGVEHEEPAAIEGFLIRLTSQKGIHKRMGKAFFKRLYFSTQDNFLVFNNPAQATPPHPPRLRTISGRNIPSAHEIAEKTPMLFEVEPYQLEDGQIKWLQSGVPERIDHHDREAYEEARRNLANLSSSDGFINMQRIKKVRKMKWGAQEVDQNLETGSDVDFHESGNDTDREDGMTGQIDDHRVFELVLDNGLIVRLQAYDEHTRQEWIHRLRKLVKYWKLRKAADLNNFKEVRKINLRNLKIDEEMEADLGQFGRKWEVNPRTEASPHIYHICPISACRTISVSGLLYRKPRRHSTFQRCSVILAGGQLLIHQSTLRKRSGKQVPHIHQEKQETIELKDCYIYSGLIVEDDLLYQNRTFDANHMGVMASLPRVWIDDGWTSSDVDVMCCFVLWTNKRKGWFRTAGTEIADTLTTPTTAASQNDAENTPEASRQTSSSMFQRRGRTKRKLKRVRQLGVPGRGMVFKCRSRAERDLWVMNIAAEIERIVERQAWEEEDEGGGVRFAS